MAGDNDFFIRYLQNYKLLFYSYEICENIYILIFLQYNIINIILTPILLQ